MEVTCENGRLWHTDCSEIHQSGLVVTIKYGNKRNLVKCLHCSKFGYYPHGGKLGYYPHGGEGAICIDEVPNKI